MAISVEDRNIIDKYKEEKQKQKGLIPLTKYQSEQQEIIDLDECVLPSFPSGCFPEWMENYVKAVAEDTQTPADLAAVIGLAVVASILSKKFKIEGKLGWEEPLNLYTVAVMNPAERKSAVFSHMTKPLLKHEAEVNKKLKPEIAANQIEKEILKNELQNLKKAASAPKKSDKTNQIELEEQARQKAKELEEFVDKKPLRLLADDVSPEKITNLLSENDGKLAIMSAEGDIFEIMAGRYSQNNTSNTGVFLKGHSGDMLRVDRVVRGADHVEEPALTIGLAIQPEVLRKVMDNENFRGKGLTARFLFSIPQSKVGSRNINSNPIPEDIKETYFTNIKLLLESGQSLEEEQQQETRILHLSEAAKIKSVQFAQMLEPRLIDDLEVVKDWAGKLHGAVLRIAGILHCCELVGIYNSWDAEVSEKNFNKAVDIGKYFIEHSKAAFGMIGMDKKTKDAKLILKFIKKKGLSEFTKRDIQKGNRTKFRSVKDVELALELLIENNFIIEEEKTVIHSSRGRKPQNKYIVNPAYLNDKK
ncbi:hypothetical protein Ccar_17700 [Clostridium carboxidivorans P7]|uniref:DUF3987 domain-containing protein n=1 Tax=Clostridium carboxidivorans P7 TaxID=536227 RepID=C6PSG0_9CLOT|nr:YfjI family protein [Clostridium carboxidivorans]AKN32582.1 hypothetical protein Ccar_17700 [Clostridium carboxidivorans P7]EET87838.1 conserved hypothetical protein [Clostridium carboxidivorans P7]EFG90210.1 hypothetical protein CLCAR_0416 [Clostridium carboxidivorans P7]